MKLKDGFYTHNVGNKQVLVGVASTGFSGLVRSNATAAFIVEQLKKETTEEEIVQTMLNEYDAPEEKIRRDVNLVIEKLRGIEALED